ncbi:MAG TPA: ferritin family protein [Bacteroidales bacterium]|jgi:rubrerythrin|nr:ferritin family protein [Bacteroidales bacterium]
MSKLNSVQEILDFAIEQEQEAVDFYNALADTAKTKDMKMIFKSFALEEIGHKARLTTIKKEGLYDWENESVADLKIADYMTKVEPGPDMDYKDALILAMKKEKNAFRLYTNLAERAPNNDLKEVFLSLASEESKHKLRFEIEYDDYVLKEN